MKNILKKSQYSLRFGFAPIFIVLAVAVIAVAVLGYFRFKKPLLTKTNIAKTNSTRASPLPRSKKPGTIKYVVTSKGIDPKTGQEVNPTNTFSANDKQVYLVMGLNSPQVGTKIEYVRYLNGRYIDHKSMEVTKQGTNYADFDWTVNKSVVFYAPGSYKVKTYTNGIFEKNVLFTVNKQGVAYCLNCD